MNLPIWEPSQERIDRANMNRFVRFVREETGNEDIQRYAPLYDFSIRSPEKFWPLVWEFCGIRASGQFEPVIENPEQMPGARFYPNVKLNFAQNLLRFRDDKPALIFRNEWGHQRQYSYAELHAEVGRMAHALKQAGVTARRPRCRLPAQPARDRDRHAGGHFAGRHLVLVLPRLRHRRRGRPLRPDRAQGAFLRRCLPLRRQDASTAWTRSAACSTRSTRSKSWWSSPTPARRRTCPACAMP